VSITPGDVVSGARLALSFAIAFVASLGATLVCEIVARRVGLVTQPREDRWGRTAIPVLGGVAIVAGLLAALGLVPGAVPRFGGFVVTALAMFGVGLLDDVRTLRPQTKLVAQIVLASLLIQMGFMLQLTPDPVTNVLLTLLWVVGITNAVNLLDNMDGLAAGMAVVAAAFRLVFFLMDADPAGAALTAAFLGAVAGFLVRNFPPARIFMGDAGSLFIGFFLAGLCLVGASAYSRGMTAVLAFPVLLMLIPIFDTTFVTLTRLASGRSVAQGGRDHTSHRLVSLGITERQALALLYGVSILSGLLAVLSYEYGFTYTIALLALLLVGLLLLGVHLSRVQIVRSEPAPPATAIVRLVADLPFKRQMATVAIDVVLIVVAYYAAYLLRFEGAFEAHRDVVLQTIAPLIIIRVSSLALCGCYRGLWRYTGLRDVLRIVQGVTLGSAAIVLYLVFTRRFENLSRAVFVLDWLLLVLFLAGSRLSFRLFAEVLRPVQGGFRRVLIYGAGDGGEMTLRELRKNAGRGREAVGFLDDDRTKLGTRIHGVPILGGLEAAEDLLGQYQIREVIVASDKIPAERRRRLEAICAAQGVPVARAVLRID
jgi:UDP-GlcNAc:undecaprenyl-phosphate GlcNAc-1-phosphate transferase